ncbi:uncharacterized protein LOC114470609 [Gouania willdenowi]|uniref:uncharacterized protein LOC114470609 n=1 Tax=Gouania willdenowi TaxID=441366 RepID=UPI001056B50B|nr:uncharacterized protein LOC114470609 [Gouania willdenowi]XP_028314690.1 uncharacterized protein LOC114470609 [Gouania willdenowi]
MEIDQLARGFRTRLTTTFDGVLRKALLDVMDVFESTMQDFKILMQQKEAQIQKLQGKLVVAELKQKKHVCRSDRRPKTENDTAKVQAVKPVSSSGKEPDDWCAPLGFETTPKKKEEFGCPSVRLRPLIISVPNIPIFRNEIVNCDLDFYLKSRKRRVSKRLSALKEGTNPILSRRLSPRQHPIIPIKQETSDQTNCKIQKRSEQILMGNVTQHRKNPNDKVTKRSAKKKKRRRVCQKVFISENERNMHVLFHHCCIGCRTVYQKRGSLLRHKSTCEKLNRGLAKTPVSTETQTTIKTENAPFLISSMDPDTIRSTFAKSARVSISGTMQVMKNL